MVYKQRFENPNYKSTASKNYAHIRYIATRPRVEKNDGRNHGLFGCLIPGTPMLEFHHWQDVAQLVYRNSKRHVVMYRSVVSFAEDTAKELMLTDKKAWQRYIENHIRTIAEKNHIQREHFQWAAAIHKEENHPHIHIVFWDDSEEKAKIKNPFTHSSIPNHIRKQMIKDTFAIRIRAYGEEKNKAVTDLRKISDELVEDFEHHVRLIERKKYQRIREECKLEVELSEDFKFANHILNDVVGKVFQLKAMLPPRGRIAYQFLSEDMKQQTDCLVKYLLSQIIELDKLKIDYVESKLKMVYLYGGNEAYIFSQKKRFEKEADKIIANRILGMVKTLNRLDDEYKTIDCQYRQRKYYAEQMILEIMDMFVSLVETNYHHYNKFKKTWNSELSKDARKELYLKYQDKGYEH